MESKMELGPLQKEWIARLRAHPERQMQEQLGEKFDDGTYKACCIGEACLMLSEKGLDINIRWVELSGSAKLYSGNCFGEIDFPSKIGLITGTGSLVKNNGEFSSLAGMNDNGMTWPDIASYIEANPDNVFYKAV